MSEAVAGFNWDAGNRKKCQKHGVTAEEIETAFGGPMRVFPDPAHSTVETRYIGIGKAAAGRHILIAFTYRVIEELRFIRPISARFMHSKEIKHYEAQSEGSREATSSKD
jgi:uncharacterized DUF497 family protein